MKAKGKVLALVLSAAALVAASVFGTMAYLTDNESVTNTFTVGKVGLSLDEADVKTDGTYETTVDSRVQENKYHLLPGHTYIKDPTVHIDETSENCWVFVKITNEISAIEIDPETETHKKVTTQMTSLGWTLVDGETDIYAYEKIAKAEDDLKVFENFTIDGEKATNDTLDDYTGKTIVVTAYAVQADGFTTAQAAWEAAGFDTGN